MLKVVCLEPLFEMDIESKIFRPLQFVVRLTVPSSGGPGAKATVTPLTGSLKEVGKLI